VVNSVALAIDQVSAAAANSTAIFWTPKLHGEGVYKLDKTVLAHTASGDAPTALDDAGVTVLARRMGRPLNVVVHNGDYIWIDLNYSGRSLNRTSSDGLTTEQLSDGYELYNGFLSHALVVDDTAIYWVAGSKTVSQAIKIEKVPLDGSPPIQLAVVAPGINTTVPAFTADDTHLYWLEDSESSNVYAVRRVSKTGGDVETLAHRTNPNNNRGLTVADGTVYFTDFPDIYSVPAQGGSVELLTGDWAGGLEAIELAVHDQTLYSMTFSGLYATQLSDDTTTQIAQIGDNSGSLTPRNLSAQPEGLYWTQRTGNDYYRVIKRMEWDTETIAVLADRTFYDSLYRAGSYLYAADQAIETEYGQIVRVPIDGGPFETILGGIQHDDNKIVTDEEYVYIQDKNALKRVSVDGGLVQTLNIDLLCPLNNPYNQFIVKDGWIYYNCIIYGGIYKISRDGGAPVLLTNDPDVGLIKQFVGIYDGYLYFVVDTNYAPAGHGKYYRMPVGGGTPELLYETSENGEILAAEGPTILYKKEWIYNDQYEMLRVDLTAGHEILLYTGSLLYEGMDKDFIYIFVSPFIQVSRVPKLGGSVEPFVQVESPAWFDMLFAFGDQTYFTISYIGVGGIFSDLYELIS
jgi:hypothetical protein